MCMFTWKLNGQTAVEMRDIPLVNLNDNVGFKEVRNDRQ